MTLYADDPDVHVIFEVTDSAGDNDISPAVVKVAGYNDIVATWVGDPAPVRKLKIPLYGLPPYRVLRTSLQVPGDNDVEFDRVVMRERVAGGTYEPSAGVDHGNVTGALTLSAGNHEMDLTGNVTVALGGTGDITIWAHGTGQTITVAGETFTIDGDEIILVVRSPRGVWSAFLAGSTEVAPPDEDFDTTHLKGHWDASTLVGTAGMPIATWTDLAGVADMAQATAGSRPTVQPASLGGLAIARFDSSDDYLQSTARVGANQTLVLLRKLAGTGNSSQMWNGCLDANTPTGGGPLIFSGNKAIFLRGVTVANDGAAGTTWERWIIRTGTTGTTLHVNGTQVITDASVMNPVTSGDTCRLGAAGNGFGSSPEYFSGGMDLAEAMVFDAVISTDEVAAIDAYLVAKWGL